MASRLATELELLEAMYPKQIEFDSRSRDFKFSDDSAHLLLRLPELYPDNGFPDVLSASNRQKKDVRRETKTAVQALQLAEGEETLDAIIACFQSVIAQTIADVPLAATHGLVKDSVDAASASGSKTVIIWLHHLLALSKRKLALSPSGTVSGVTKPGYPGIMVFTGPTAALNDHVNALRAENWQAFQVRYEENEPWEFAHAEIKEVETMAEVVQTVEFGTDGPRRKEEFLKAVGIK